MITSFNLSGAAALVLAGAAGVGLTVERGPVWVERESYLMGTVLRGQVAARDRQEGFAALEAAFAEVRRLEGLLSSWTAESDLGRVNAAEVGEEVPVPAELMVSLEEAAGWAERTGGAFDPGVGALVDAWGLRGEGRRPGAAELEVARAASGLDRFRLDPAAGTVRRLSAGAWIDSGGFGKGAALRAAQRVLRGRGVEAALLDFGGQISVFGQPPAGAEWEIAVAHPEMRHAPAGAVWLRSGSVATSAQSERYVEVEGDRFGHILDPGSGRPVPAWGSVTVVADDAVTADVLSTALLVMGPEEGRRWAAGRAEGVLFVELRDGTVIQSWNAAFERYRRENDTTERTRGV